MTTKTIQNNYFEVITITKTNDTRNVCVSSFSWMNRVIWTGDDGFEWVKAGRSWRRVFNGNDASDKNNGNGGFEVTWK